jgi:hypothetical protein
VTVANWIEAGKSKVELVLSYKSTAAAYQAAVAEQIGSLSRCGPNVAASNDMCGENARPACTVRGFQVHAWHQCVAG